MINLKRKLNEDTNAEKWYPDKDTVYSSEDISNQVTRNIQDENDAIAGYLKLIGFFQNNGDQEAVDQIKEIIADEKNHRLVLEQLSQKYDGIAPAKS